MLGQVRSATLRGIEAAAVWVEVNVTPGLPSFTKVGLPDSTLRESRDRIRAAIKNAGFELPMEGITVNLAPADQRKEGPALDLPMAIGLLAATDLLKAPALDRCLTNLEDDVRCSKYDAPKWWDFVRKGSGGA